MFRFQHTATRLQLRQRLILERLENRLAPSAGYFRIVSYNISASSSPGIPDTGLTTILQAIGAEPVPETDPPVPATGRTQPIDLIALQEVHAQSTTSKWVADELNDLYPSADYSYGSMNGDSKGSGTQGVVFNTQTMQLLGQKAIGVASTAGQPRQALRYHFQPIGYPSSAAFYLYNSHYKADDDSVSLNRRQIEAAAIRADADLLGSVNIIYAGDFNAYSSSEQFYQTLLSGGDGQAFDPIDTPGKWTNSGAYITTFTQAPAKSPPGGLTGGGLDDRFDFQLNSGELTDGKGIDYVANTYHAFGNNGSVALNGNINDPDSKALMPVPNRTTVLNLLTTVTDHLPVVADYQIMIPPTANVQINDGSAQRSNVTTVTVTFSVNVAFPTGISNAIQLQRNGPGGPTGSVNLGFQHSDNIVTITFNDPTFAPPAGAIKSLIDGKYALTLIAANIQGAGGKFDGNGDGIGGDSQMFSLHRLFGDSNGDMSVNSVDFAAFRMVFGLNSFAFDADGDNQITASDFAFFRMRFGTML